MSSEQHRADETADDLIAVIRLLRGRMRAVPSDGLSPAQNSVLIRLYKEGASSTTLLALADGVKSQSMTATLNSLDALGLLHRERDPEDGRRQIISLSADGRTRAARDRAGRGAWLAKRMQQELDDAELATVHQAVSLLRRVVDGE